MSEERIDIFPWDERFATGLELVDQQHRRLVEVLNELATAVALGAGDEALDRTFDALVAYAGYHFDTEEAIWAAHLADDLLEHSHRAGHADFVARVLALRESTGEGDGPEVTEALLEFLVRWLAAHILESDRFMANLVLALRDGATRAEAQARAEAATGGQHRVVVDLILTIYGTLTRNTLRLMRQIAAHRLKDEALARSEARFRGLFELLPLGVCLSDAEGRLLAHNPSAARLLGPGAAALDPEDGVWRLLGTGGEPLSVGRCRGWRRRGAVARSRGASWPWRAPAVRRPGAG